MLDLKTAYQILGLPENATEQEIEDRFLLLLRKNKSRSQHADDSSAVQDHAGQPDGPTLEEIREAYNFIRNKALEEAAGKVGPKSKTQERFGYIWDYYRYHILISIVAVIAVFYLVSGMMENRREAHLVSLAEVRVRFFTSYLLQEQDTDLFKSRLQKAFPEWKYATVESQYSPIDIKNEFDMAQSQKALITIGQEKRDLLITDEANFKKFGTLGTFIKLSDLKELASTPVEKQLQLKTEDDTKPEWYGVDITGSKVLEGLAPSGLKIVAVIQLGAKEQENAAKVIAWLESAR